jgi:hypothetical protein
MCAAGARVATYLHVGLATLGHPEHSGTGCQAGGGWRRHGDRVLPHRPPASDLGRAKRVGDTGGNDGAGAVMGDGDTGTRYVRLAGGGRLHTCTTQGRGGPKRKVP